MYLAISNKRESKIQLKRRLELVLPKNEVDESLRDYHSPSYKFEPYIHQTEIEKAYKNNFSFYKTETAKNDV